MPRVAGIPGDPGKTAPQGMLQDGCNRAGNAFAIEAHIIARPRHSLQRGCQRSTDLYADGRVADAALHAWIAGFNDSMPP